MSGQLDMKEPEQLDWDNAFKGSSYEAPPPALGPDNRPIEYQFQVVGVKEAKNLDEGYLNYEIDLKLTQTGVNYSRILKTWASTRPFMKRAEDGTLQPIKGNPNSLGKFLRSAGLQGKPQTNEQYKQAMKSVGNARVKATGDWEARAKDGSETIRGYLAFPPEDANPSVRKPILKRGEVYLDVDKRGNILGTKTVESEILFANFRVKYFSDPTPRVAGQAR